MHIYAYVYLHAHLLYSKLTGVYYKTTPELYFTCQPLQVSNLKKQ